jgi:signal transduction histidine kinase
VAGEDLAAAIGREVARWTRCSGVPVDLRLCSRHIGASPETNLHLCRVIQECLQNVSKHARARRVLVTLSVSDSTLTLVIADDGRGFPVEGRSAYSSSEEFGLVKVRERVALLGGSVTIDSEQGLGTTVLITAPIAAPSSARAGEASDQSPEPSERSSSSRIRT